MSLAGLRGSNTGFPSVTSNISNSDKASLYLELISACSKLRKFAEASALIEETRAQLANGPEEGRAIIGHAELCLEMDEIERAIELLSSIGPDQPYYIQARTKLAEVHLTKRKDRQSFARCFRFVFFLFHCFFRLLTIACFFIIESWSRIALERKVTAC